MDVNMDLKLDFDYSNANPLKHCAGPLHQHTAQKSSMFFDPAPGSTQTRPGPAAGQAAPVTPSNTSALRKPPSATTPVASPSLKTTQSAQKVKHANDKKVKHANDTKVSHTILFYEEHMAKMRKAANHLTTHFSSKLPSEKWVPLFKQCKEKYNNFLNFPEIMAMPMTERVAMVQGPVVNIHCAGERIEFPMFMLPWMGFKICHGSKAPGLVRQDIDASLINGIRRLADYLKISLCVIEPSPLRAAGIDAASFAFDLDTMMAAEGLGLSQAAGPLYEHWAEWLKSNSIEEIGFDKLQVIADRMAAECKCKLFHVVIDKLVFDYIDDKIKELTLHQFCCWLIRPRSMLECFQARRSYILAYGRPI